MKSLFRWSHEEGHIRKNPAAKIKEPKIGKRIPKFLTEREIEHLREANSYISDGSKKDARAYFVIFLLLLYNLLEMHNYIVLAVQKHTKYCDQVHLVSSGAAPI